MGQIEEEEEYSVLVVEDEKWSRELLTGYIHDSKYFILKDTATDGIRAKSLLEKNKYDLVFMDISMPGLSGPQVINELDYIPNLIITTVSKDFAIKAFEMGVIDYLLKPISPTRFETAQNKALEILRYRKILSAANEKEPQKQLTDVPLAEILKSEFGLTTQESHIAKLIFDGVSREELREELNITNQTLKQHLRAIYSKTIDLESESPVKHHGKVHIFMNFLMRICQDALLQESEAPEEN